MRKQQKNALKNSEKQKNAKISGCIKDKVSFCQESLSVMLHVSEKEYEDEIQRIGTIDSKTSISLPIIAAFCLTVLVEFVDGSGKWTLLFNHLNILRFFCNCICFCSLILAGGATIKMIKVIYSKTYTVLKSRDFYDEDYLKADSEVIKLMLIKLYIESSEKNKIRNDERIKNYQKAWKWALISFIAFFVFKILNMYL